MTPRSGPRVATVSAEPRSRRRDTMLIVAGVVLTVVLSAAAVQRPVVGFGLLAVLALVSLFLPVRHHLARIRIGDMVVAGLIALPLLALLGPSFALPSFPQLFAFRLALALLGFVGVTYLIAQPKLLPFAAGDLALPLALWFVWLCVGLLWAPEKLAALNYLAIVVTMLAVLAATAAAGSSRRLLFAFTFTMIAAFVLIVGFTVLEARFGLRLPTSRLLTTVTSQTYAVTSVFHNQNDLATYIALCWPFMLCAFFFTRRPLWLALSVLCIALGAAAFVRTGSRSSLVAIGLSSFGAAVLFAQLGPRLSTRAGKIVGALVAMLFIGGAGYLLFNDSESAMLRQFRLESLVAQSQAGTGSGAIRTSLTSRGLEIAGSTLLVGAGPGQAEGIIASGIDGLGISNLHNWWLETYVNGGLVGFALHLVFFAGLLFALWPIARHDPDPLMRYLAGGTVLALVGFTIGALGPSSSVSFVPMWIVYGLGLAVVSRARLAAGERAVPEAAASRPPVSESDRANARSVGDEVQA